jgi:two-component SAPR family response regulator
MTQEQETQPAISSLAGHQVLVYTQIGLFAMQLNKALKLSGLKVVCTHSLPAESLACEEQKQPELILLDTDASYRACLDMAGQILARRNVCIVFIASHDLNWNEAAEMGVTGLLLKPVTSEGMLEALSLFWEAHTLRQQGTVH